MKPRQSIPLTLCFLLAGCASYRYEISAADAPVRQISKDAQVVIPAAPAQLRVQQSDSRCVLFVENTGQQDFSIDGSASAVIDPAGQSHPIAARVIPPGSHVKFILPPMRDTNRDEPGFRIGLGLGMQVDATEVSGPREAKYLYLSTDGQEYWEWSGEGAVRLVFAFRQGEQLTKHNFKLERFKK